jgi:hypothetical protein
MSKPILAWWFCAADKLPHGDGRPVVVGETHDVEGEIVPCERGLHASARLIDALKYAEGPILYRVRLSGTVKSESDKLAASRRTYLWRIDATRVLHLFACDVAEEALARAGNPDPRSVEAIRVKRAWVDGKATDAQLDAARAAAWAAARDAARAAARAAAWAAARDAARAAARAAARDAARDAARAAQNKRLTKMVMRAHRNQGGKR